MSNEAAERLRAELWHLEDLGRLLVDEALAAERRAGATEERERIRAALDHPLTEDQNAIAVIRAVLDAEAER